MSSNLLMRAACLALPLLLASPVGGQEAITLPEGEGREVVGMACSQCHSLKALFVYKGDDRQWEVLVHEMVAFGTQVSPRERDTILAYLKATFSLERTAGGRDAAPLPSGKGRELLQASCDACHGLPLIARKRAGRAEWETILRRHTSEERVELSAAQTETLLEYLAASFGPSAGSVRPPAAEKAK